MATHMLKLDDQVDPPTSVTNANSRTCGSTWILSTGCRLPSGKVCVTCPDTAVLCMGTATCASACAWLMPSRCASCSVRLVAHVWWKMARCEWRAWGDSPGWLMISCTVESCSDSWRRRASTMLRGQGGQKGLVRRVARVVPLPHGSRGSLERSAMRAHLSHGHRRV